MGRFSGGFEPFAFRLTVGASASLNVDRTGRSVLTGICVIDCLVGCVSRVGGGDLDHKGLVDECRSCHQMDVTAL